MKENGLYTVCVLMSTYNGEKYIREQIDSILNQRDVLVKLYIRDDGSKDNTLKIIEEYQKKYDNIKLAKGENIGYKKSFMFLTYNAPDADYYAYADQDDVWLSNKMIQAINMIKEGDQRKPVLYYSMMTQVDEKLKIMQEQQTPKIMQNKIMSLFQNFAQGSTILFNAKLLEKVKSYHIEKEVSHDIWLPICALFLGEVVFDNNSYILYRRHNESVTVKMSSSYWKNLIKQVMNFNEIDNYAIYLLDGYKNELSFEMKSKLLQIKEYYKIKNKVDVLLDKNVKKYTFKGTVMLKTAIIINRLEKR